MDAGMDELADNVIQVTDPNSSNFDALTPFSPIPTGYKTGLMRLYFHKLHALPFDQHDELCNKIDKVAKNFKTTGDAVSYAVFLTNWHTKNNKNAKEERVTNSLLNIDNVNCTMKELKMVRETTTYFHHKRSTYYRQRCSIEDIIAGGWNYSIEKCVTG